MTVRSKILSPSQVRSKARPLLVFCMLVATLAAGRQLLVHESGSAPGHAVETLQAAEGQSPALPAGRYPNAQFEPGTQGEGRRAGTGRERGRGFDPLSLSLSPPDPGDGRLPDCPPRRRASGTAYEFYFSRAAYSGWATFGYASWSVDYPKADRQFLIGLDRLVEQLDQYPCENPILLDDPGLAEFPFLYAVEVGKMTLNPSEQAGLRRYLLGGGFLMIDDFWGSQEWRNLVQEFEQVLPEFPVEEVPLDHPVFHGFYDIERLVQVPNVGLGRQGGPTWEKDGYEPFVRGIFDEDRRLMVLINGNCDLGDAWEWAEDPYYPLEFSTYAYQIGVNAIVYAMTH